MATVWFWLVQVGTVMQENNGNSSAQDFAFTAKKLCIYCKVRENMLNLAKGNLPLAAGDLEWADSVTEKPRGWNVTNNGYREGMRYRLWIN